MSSLPPRDLVDRVRRMKAPSAKPMTSKILMLPLLNSWVNFGAPWEEAHYRKDADAVVHLSGSVKDGTIGQNVFVLPEGFRPATARTFAVVSVGSFGRVDVYSDGSVAVIVGSNVHVALDGISFIAEQ